MTLPLDDSLKIGVNTMLRRTEPASGPWMPTVDELVEVVQQVDRLGFDSFWCGDHVAFAIPFLDPIAQIAQAAVVSRRLTFGTAVYLLPLRHPTPVAKQIATLDHLTGGRFIFGVGFGGEFPKEYEGCGVPIKERGSRLGEGIEVIRKLWTGEKVSHDGRFYNFKDVKMTPTPRQPGGPPIWCGGRSDPALRRAARLADGWFSYAVSPEMFAKGLMTIEAAMQEAGRNLDRFGTAHLMFTRIDDSYERALDAASESLSVRYAMNMRPATERYEPSAPPARLPRRSARFTLPGSGT
jgi:probable F420-dependent oxidoreductase